MSLLSEQWRTNLSVTMQPSASADVSRVLRRSARPPIQLNT
jgi:hypothetical protein